MCEIDPQVAEKRPPALGVTLELIIPIVGAGEPTVNYADNAGSTGASFDDPFRPNWPGFFHSLDRVQVWRVPGPYRANRVHARAKAGGGNTVYTLFDLGWYKPG